MNEVRYLDLLNMNRKKANMKSKIEQLIDKHYDQLFDEVIHDFDDLFDLVIEYKSLGTGKTIRRSWKDREKRLGEEEII